jgi:hypothetical protein
VLGELLHQVNLQEKRQDFVDNRLKKALESVEKPEDNHNRYCKRHDNEDAAEEAISDIQ